MYQMLQRWRFMLHRHADVIGYCDLGLESTGRDPNVPVEGMARNAAFSQLSLVPHLRPAYWFGRIFVKER